MSNHIEAKKDEIANVVIMPGDPKRASMIAAAFLKDAKLVNTVRGNLAYTGYTPGGKRVTVMASGMGQPSIGIYSYELYNDYNVDLIIRVGTCGCYQENIKMGDLLIAETASTDTNYAYTFELDGIFSAGADFYAMNTAYCAAKRKNMKIHVGNILSSDIFYDNNINRWKKWKAMNVLGVEMESYALYCNAAKAKKKALCILTVTDNFITNEHMTFEQREKLKDMPAVAIEVAEKFAKK